MIIEFIINKIDTDCNVYKIASKYNKINEFIIVGEEDIDNVIYARALQCNSNGITLLSGIGLKEQAFYIKKEDICPRKHGIGIETYEFDIPKEFLTVDLVDEIQRLNNISHNL